MNLSIVTKEMFGQNEMAIYENENKDIFMTREQIGQALEYKNPRRAIKDIHLRNKDRLDEFSRGAQIDTPSGKQETIIYNEKGIYEIIRRSAQPKADEFYDWVYELLEKLRKRELEVSKPKTQLEILQQSINQLVEQEQRINKIEQNQENITNIIKLNNSKKWREETNKIINSIARNNGGTYKQTRQESYARLETRARCELEARLRNKTYRLQAQGAPKRTINNLNYLDVIADDDRLIEIYLSIVKEMAVEHNVEKAI